jgi:hypothetical protein
VAEQDVEIRIVAKPFTAEAFRVLAENMKAVDGQALDTSRAMEVMAAHVRAAREPFGQLNAEGASMPRWLDQVHSTAETTFSDMTSQAKAFAVGLVSAQAIIGGVQAAFRGAAAFVAESVSSYASAEAAAKKMTVALMNQGTASKANVAHMNDLATQVQRTTVYSDDLANEMEALFTQVGNVAPAQMDKAMASAADLASGLGIGLQDSVSLLSKAFEGNVGALSRYGIHIDEAKVKAEGMPAVLDAINERFGGQAQAEAATYAGRIKQIANEWDNVKESVGKAIVTDPSIVRLLDYLQGRITGIGDSAEQYQPTITDWWARLAGGDSAAMAVAYFNSIDQAIQGINEDLAKTPKAPKVFEGGDGGFLTNLKKQTDDVVRATIEGWTKETAAADKYKEKVAEVLRTFSGADGAQQAKILGTVLRQLTDAGALTAHQLHSIGEAASKLRDEGTTLSPTLLALVHAQQLLDAATKNTASSVEYETARWKEAQKSVENYLRAIPHAIFKTESFAPRNGVPLIDVKAVQEAAGTATRIADTTFHDIEGRMAKTGVFSRTVLEKQAADAREKFASMVASHRFTTEEIEAQWRAMIAANDAATGGLAAGFHRVLATIPQTMVSAMTGGGGFSGAFQAIGASTGIEIGTKAFGPKGFLKGVGEMIPGIGPAIGSLLGPAIGLITKMFSTAGRDAIKAFGQQLTGSSDLNALHTLLQEKLPAEAEKYWILLTQGTDRHNAQQAAANIKIVQDALAAAGHTFAEQAAAAGYQTTAQMQTAARDAVKLWEFMRDSGQYSADAVAQAWQKAQEAIAGSGDAQVTSLQSALDAAKSGLAALDSEIASLQKSIESEATEDVMGVVETQARARLEALQRERDAAAKHVEDLNDQLTAAMNRVADALEKMPKNPFEDWRVPEPGGGGDGTGPHDSGHEPPAHAEGAYIRQDHVARVHAGEIIGPADFMTRALEAALTRVGTGVGGGSNAHAGDVYLDGEKVGTHVLRKQGQLLNRYRVRR